MLRRIAIALAASSLIGATSIPTGALAFGHGGGHGGFGGGFGHGGFAGGGFTRGFGGAPHAFAGPGFAGRGFAPGFRGDRFGAPFGLGLGLGYGFYGYYDDPCYAWTPYGYTSACGYDY
jgi:hypothetical protein